MALMYMYIVLPKVQSLHVHEYYIIHVHLSWISMHIIYSCVALFYITSQCIYMYRILLIPLVCVYMYVHVHHVN